MNEKQMKSIGDDYDDYVNASGAKEFKDRLKILNYRINMPNGNRLIDKE